jgi:chromatin segregation and condensation protein Rec8/ScpA/Scc1 (kleisin family)
MTSIAEHLRKQPRAALLELVYLNCEEPTRLDVVITFLAILELTKLKIIRITQTSLTARELYIERAVADWDPDSAWLDGADEPL